ncbi:MAG: hypothetical protein ABWZ79_18870 [Pedobacter agri]
MKFCVIAKISKRSVSFWYQSEGNAYAPLIIRESNVVPLYFYVNGNDFIFGNIARERFYRNDTNAYGNYFDIIKDPSKHFVIYGNKKPVKQLFYYGIEQYLSHFLNTILYKADSIESYRQQFPLRFLFDTDIEDNEKSLIENLFQEAGYFNLDHINYNQVLFDVLISKHGFPRDKSILVLCGIENVLYLNLYQNHQGEIIGSAKLAGQGADPRVKILAEMIIEYITIQNSYLSIDNDKEVGFLLPYCAGLLQNIMPIITGEIELSDGNRYWFKVNEKNLKERLQYYANDGMIFTVIDDLLKANDLTIDQVVILLGSEEINTAYFSEKLLKRYHHVKDVHAVVKRDAMQAIFIHIASQNYKTKTAMRTTSPTLMERPPLPPMIKPPPLPPKRATENARPLTIPKLPEVKKQNIKPNTKTPPPLPPKKG